MNTERERYPPQWCTVVMVCTVELYSGVYSVQWWSTLPMQSEVSQGSVSLASESACSLYVLQSTLTAEYTNQQPSEAVVEDLELAENGVKYPGLFKVKQIKFCLPKNIEIFDQRAIFKLVCNIVSLYLPGK